MDSVSSATSASLYSLAAFSGSGAAPASGSDAAADPNGPAARLELTALQQQGQMMSTLLGSLNTASPSSLFDGANTVSMLNAQGTAAMAYLSPQAAPAGQSINALA